LKHTTSYRCVALAGGEECIVPIGNAAGLTDIFVLIDSQQTTPILTWLVVGRHPYDEDLIMVTWSGHHEVEMCPLRPREKGISRLHLTSARVLAAARCVPVTLWRALRFAPLTFLRPGRCEPDLLAWSYP
jgi:hypothetical protein